MADLEDGHRAGILFNFYGRVTSNILSVLLRRSFDFLFRNSASFPQASFLSRILSLVDRTCAFLFDRVCLNEGTDGMFGYRVNKRTRNATPQQREEKKRRMNQRIARTTRMERVSPVAIVPVNPFTATKHRVPSGCSNFYVYLDTFAT